MSTKFKARCDSCGTVYKSNELVVMRTKTYTVERKIFADVEREYETQELSDCKECGCGTFEIIISNELP